MNYRNIIGMSAVIFFGAMYATENVAYKGGASTRISGSAIQGALCEILRKLDELQCSESLCEAVVITEAQILSESGTYCLGNDITGTIFITGSGITLNLNGHIISAGSDGIAVSDTASGIVIKNGLLKGSGSDNGIFITGATDVRIENISCEDWDHGISLNDAYSVKIEDVTCTACGVGINVLEGSTVTLDRVISSNNDSYGLVCEAVKGLVARDSSFDYNIAVGVRTQQGVIAEFIRCNAVAGLPIATDQTYGAGFEVGDVNAQLVFRDCSAMGYLGGFSLAVCGADVSVDMYNCVTAQNDIGFILRGSDVYLVNCIAKNNNTGYLIDSECDFSVVLRDCHASGNVDGFVDSSGSSRHMFLNCVACNNGTNYSPNIIAANNAPVKSAEDARGFDNVDCSIVPTDV